MDSYKLMVYSVSMNITYARFYLVEVEQLKYFAENPPTVSKKLCSNKQVNGYLDYLHANAKKLDELQCPTDLYYCLLTYLYKYKYLNTTQNEYDADRITLIKRSSSYQYIFSHAQKADILNQLHTVSFSLPEFNLFSRDFLAEEGVFSTEQVVDAITMLRTNLSAIPSKDFILLLILEDKQSLTFYRSATDDFVAVLRQAMMKFWTK